MNSTETAFLFFYGLFWACALSAISIFRPFDTTILFDKDRFLPGIIKILLSLFIANVLPILGLYFFYKSSLSDLNQPKGVFLSAILSMTVFSIPRLIHAVLLNVKTHKFFYSSEELALLHNDLRKPDPCYQHLIPGILYILIPVLITLIIVN